MSALSLIIGGFALLVLGGEILLRGAVGLANIWRLPPAVIGLTVVAAGTSVPELAVSVVAAFQGNADIAVGNVVGSNIFNIAAIVGLCAVVRPLTIGGTSIKLEFPVLAAVTALFVVFSRGGEISRGQGVVFLFIYVAFTYYAVKLVRRSLPPHEASEFRAEVIEIDSPRAGLAKSISLTTFGIALLGVGAEFTVDGAVQIASILGMSQRVVGLTIVAAGTGLPEIVTSLVSSFRGRDDVAIANVIGSNLFNLLAILGLSALFHPLQIAPAIVNGDSWWMLGITLLLFPLMFTERKVVRWEGAVLLLSYGGYLWFVLGR